METVPERRSSVVQGVERETKDHRTTPGLFGKRERKREDRRHPLVNDCIIPNDNKVVGLGVKRVDSDVGAF